ncbi:hypothetical protein EDB92DRAFT_1892844, partial [Lactarius akahatsu]
MRRFLVLRFLLFPLIFETPKPQRRQYKLHSSVRVKSTPVLVLSSTSNFATAEFGDKDPDRWRNTFEVNIRGVYNTV